MVKRGVLELEVGLLKQAILEEECNQALMAMGLEKYLGWDGISVELWQEWRELVIIRTNTTFLKRGKENSVSRGLIKPTPK